MAVIRSNIVLDTAARDAFVRGVMLLKNEVSAVNTTDFGIPGPATPVRSWDLFVIWHHTAMTTLTPPPPAVNTMGRNAAHRGPVFLPWHRVFLIFLEQNLQRVLNDSDFGLPYWDWSVDGSLPPPLQPTAVIWSDDYMGGGGEVLTGPFGFNAADPNSFRVRLETDLPNNMLRQVSRPLRRALGQLVPTLPTAVDVGLLFNPLDASLNSYDMPDWDANSTGLRNRLEGTAPGGTGLHNQVHNWVGGDMMPPSSPNDPVFFLHHCNVDRIWQGWLNRHGTVYQPDTSVPEAPVGHRMDDPILSPLLPGVVVATPKDVLDVSATYAFDLVP